MNGTDLTSPVESYFEAVDGNLVIRDKFVSRRDVEAIVQHLGQDGLGRNQIQRFFRHCRKLELQLRRKERTWGEVRSTLLALPAHAVNGMERPRDQIPQSFVDFITRNVNMIHTEVDFAKGFMRHFECVLGYAPKYLKKGDR
jgi:hypothetical protein